MQGLDDSARDKAKVNHPEFLNSFKIQFSYYRAAAWRQRVKGKRIKFHEQPPKGIS
jgi:hypothetical protein